MRKTNIHFLRGRGGRRGQCRDYFWVRRQKWKKKWKRVTFFSGYSKDKNFLSTLLKKNSVVQESIAYYLKITTLYKFFKQSGCSRRCLIKCTLVFYCTNQSVHLYCCIILSTSTETSHDFKWFSLAEMKLEMVFTWLGMLYPEIRGISVYVNHWILLRRERDRWGTRMFGRWSRHRHFSNIVSDPVQIQCTLTSWLKACTRYTLSFWYNIWET